MDKMILICYDEINIISYYYDDIYHKMRRNKLQGGA